MIFIVVSPFTWDGIFSPAGDHYIYIYSDLLDLRGA